MKRIKHWLPGLMGALSLLVGIATAQEAGSERHRVDERGAAGPGGQRQADLQGAPAGAAPCLQRCQAGPHRARLCEYGQCPRQIEPDLQRRRPEERQHRPGRGPHSRRPQPQQGDVLRSDDRRQEPLLAMVPSATPGQHAGRSNISPRRRPAEGATAFATSRFRRGKDGEGRITVDLTDPNAGIDIKQQGSNLVVDFVKVTVPEALRKRLDVTDFATPVLSVNDRSEGRRRAHDDHSRAGSGSTTPIRATPSSSSKSSRSSRIRTSSCRARAAAIRARSCR
jgi:hypothetical protein